MLNIVVAIFIIIAGTAASDGSLPISFTNGALQAEVKDKLDDPTGTMRSGNRIIWMYPRGTVEFENGRVVRSDFLSDKDYAKEQVRRAQLAEAKRLADAAAAKPAAAAWGPPRPPDPSGQASIESRSTRFVRPFIRPSFDNVQYYNSIPVVFELSKWPPAMRKDYDLSVEIPLETGQRGTTFQTLPYEMKKYPDEMLEQTLRCIYMIRDIRGEGKAMNPSALAFYTEGIVLSHTCFFHHEYAHELTFLFHKDFPAKQISAVSGEYKGFDERKSVFYKDLWKLGFVSNYAMSNVAEDFAEFCDMLYLQPVTLFAAMKDNPKLQEKFNIIRPFLEMVKRRTTGDAAPMDEAYFSKFDRAVWKP